MYREKEHQSRRWYPNKKTYCKSCWSLSMKVWCICTDHVTFPITKDLPIWDFYNRRCKSKRYSKMNQGMWRRKSLKKSRHYWIKKHLESLMHKDFHSMRIYSEVDLCRYFKIYAARTKHTKCAFSHGDMRTMKAILLSIAQLVLNNRAFS